MSATERPVCATFSAFRFLAFLQVGRTLSDKDGFNGQVRLAKLQAPHCEHMPGTALPWSRFWGALGLGRRNKRSSWHGCRYAK